MGKSKANVNPIQRIKKVTKNLDKIDLPAEKPGNNNSIDNTSIDVSVNNNSGSLSNADNLYEKPQVNNPNKLGEIDTKVTTKEATPLGEIDTKVSENAKIELPNIHGEVGARPTVELPNVYGTASTNNSLGNETVNDVVANSTTPSPLSNVNN